jgi:diguanylate cyclase (GGDEF)-like protein/PAS domain S-box-containing protein
MPQNVLLIENDLSCATIVRDALIGTGDFQVDWVRYCIDGLERVVAAGRQAKRHPDGIAAVLADLFLADSHGIATFDRLFCAAPQIPILVLTTAQDESIAKLAVEHGAHDYLLKTTCEGDSFPKALASMVERAANADALFEEKERAQVTLNCTGDGVVSIDILSHVTYLNAVAESITGWSAEEALGRPIGEVFRLVNATSRVAAINPMLVAIRQNRAVVGLTPNCAIVRRDGLETAIADSAAPIHDRRGHVTGAVMVFGLSAARALSAKMAYLAQHDSLTELANRVLLKDRLTQSISLAQRHRQKLAVLYLDVDRFKHINDSLGHGIGDRVLQSIAQRLVSSVRSSDTVSRHGGDEFVILLAEAAHAQDATVSADKILLALAAPHLVEHHVLRITTSIGIAIYPDDGTDADTLLKHADSAMLHAKNSGRDNYQFFKAEMNVRALERQSHETGLRHALEQDQFVLHYQPKMDLETGEIVGAEALIRWRHPQRGLLAPGCFIPIAERCGYIVPISRWVMREACRQAHSWQDAGLPSMRIAINTSAVELRSNDFAAAVGAILVETSLEPRYLELEFREALLFQDPEATAATLRALKAIGVRLALDNFGTGFSSLSYLKRYQLDTLKIDQSFVHDLTADGDNAAIVSAVIAMGQSLRLQVVAEGVETREQLDFLRDHACPEGQGFYLGHPVAAAEFSQFLERSAVRFDSPALAYRRG